MRKKLAELADTVVNLKLTARVGGEKEVATPATEKRTRGSPHDGSLASSPPKFKRPKTVYSMLFISFYV